jgi:hypothetical protein
MANPPFGGKERKEVQQNFPSHENTRSIQGVLLLRRAQIIVVPVIGQRIRSPKNLNNAR